ncbi:IS5 family transposase [Burkholderia ubonensis]|uniref:IS5 family transposase n=1 Tax=Burkholderia ubonensis TaxID=101571 RepID=UPI000A773DCF|nr:IS5 family transposase [Burkholderia ubonensis]
MPRARAQAVHGRAQRPEEQAESPHHEGTRVLSGAVSGRGAGEADGTPLAAILTGTNVNDVAQLLPLIDAIPPIRGLRGHPLQRPRVVYADRGYDSERHRRALRDRGIEPVIAKRRTEHGSGLSKYRWVVERTHAWLHHFRHLRIRFERRADIHCAFLNLGCCLICWNTLRRAQQPL